MTVIKMLRREKIETRLSIDGAEELYPQIAGKSIELLIELVETRGQLFEITFRNSAKLIYDMERNEISLVRKNAKTGERETRTCSVSSLSAIHVFLDHSSLEIFLDGGKEVFTARYFPNTEDMSIVFAGHAILDVKKWDLQGFEVKEQEAK